MTGYQIISDLQRVVRLEAESALPNGPIRPETPRVPRQSITTTLRLNTTLALRRLADAVEPARACLDAPAQPKGQRS
jgi:hypothetical protein